MKSEKSKVKSSNGKLEISLTEKLKDFVKSLGHDAEEIGDEIKKASKILSKKLKSKIKKAKTSLDNKVSDLKKDKKTKKKADKKLIKETPVNDKKKLAEVEKIINKAKKQTETAPKKASSVKNVDVLPVLNKDTATKEKAVVTKAKPVSKPIAKAPVAKAPVKAASAKPVVKKAPLKAKTETKEDKNDNSHPETPEVPKRNPRAKVAPKSDTKPKVTDLPDQAGPNNKYNRG